MPSWLPRMGLTWILDKSLDHVNGMAAARKKTILTVKQGIRLDIYNSTVKEMYVPYLIPQDYGLRTDNRWVKMADGNGIGLEFKGN